MVLEFEGKNNKIIFGGDVELLRSSEGTLALGAGNSWAANAINWSGVDKTGSSLADLATRNYSDLSGRPADDDFNTLAAGTDVEATDYLAIYDSSLSAYRKVSFAKLSEEIEDDDQTRNSIPEGLTFIVKEGYQHIIYNSLYVAGDYVVNGESIVL